MDRSHSSGMHLLTSEQKGYPLPVQQTAARGELSPEQTWPPASWLPHAASQSTGMQESSWQQSSFSLRTAVCRQTAWEYGLVRCNNVLYGRGCDAQVLKTVSLRSTLKVGNRALHPWSSFILHLLLMTCLPFYFNKKFILFIYLFI